MGKRGRPRKVMATRSNSKTITRSTSTSLNNNNLGFQTQRIVKPRRGRKRVPKKSLENDILLRFIHIEQNEFVHRGHKQQRDDDVPVCACKYEDDNLDTACGDQCLNVLTSTECTPGFCPCGESCRNQRFQRKEYIKSKLLKTDGCGWGLIADQDVKAGEFVIEYCGEVISCEEARIRSHDYEAEGLKDSYIISLSGSEFIDATRKGNLARFVNHSCEPNCETRKWTVLGEVRVGIFAKHDIKAGTELAYNYYFEWYGGIKVRCRCGAASCLGFLGANSRGFQDDAYVWDDNDERYCVENIPLYDSEDDEPLSNFLKRAQVCNKLKKASSKRSIVKENLLPIPINVAEDARLNALEENIVPCEIKRHDDIEELNFSLSQEIDLEHEGDKRHIDDRDCPLDRVTTSYEKSGCDQDAIGMARTDEGPPPKTEGKEHHSEKIQDDMTGEKRPGKRHLVFRNKRARLLPLQQSPKFENKCINVQSISQLFVSKKGQEEVAFAQEAQAAASAEMEKLHAELQPVVEEHRKDGQDGIPIALAEKWIAASCKQLQTLLDFHFSLVKELCHVIPAVSATEVVVPQAEN